MHLSQELVSQITYITASHKYPDAERMFSGQVDQDDVSLPTMPSLNHTLPKT